MQNKMYFPQKSIHCGLSVLLLLIMVAALQSKVFAQTEPSVPPLPILATGANESVFASVQETYYVVPTGDDNASGTSSEPFKTFAKGVSKAVERKNANVSVRIIIRDGVYREKVGIPPLGTEVTDDTEAAIIIEAQNTGQAIISGSEDWSGQWTEEGDAWTRDWPFDWGIGAAYNGVNATLGRRRELFFVEGIRYRQVLSTSELAEGTYYVDEANNKAYIRPLAGVNMNTALVEVGMLLNLFTINANRKNIAIKGLVFQHEASFTQSGGINDAAFRLGNDCQNILLEDVTIARNNNSGFGTPGNSQARQNITFRRVKFNNNGGGGMYLFRSQNILVLDCETSYNRFRSLWANQFQGYSPGGFKLAWTHRSTFIRHKAVDNYGRGMWWDTANRDITARDCYVEGNYISGIFDEYNFGPCLIDNCTVVNTKRSERIGDRNHGGILFASTEKLSIKNCTIKNNYTGQIKCWDQQRTMTDHLTGEEKRYDNTNVGNIYLRDNKVESSDSTQSLIDIPDWLYLKNTWDSDSNTYRHSAREDAFRVYQGGTADGDDASDTNYFMATYYTFAEWKQYIDGDVNSTFGEVSGPEEIPVVLPDSIGAYIDESNIQAHYYVSPTGLNTNTGTSPEEALANPFVAIERANANSLAQGLVTKIHIANGMYIIARKEYNYRDSAIAPAAKSTTLIIEGETYRSVILDGNNTGRLNLKGKSNLVMRNLVFTNCGGEAAFKAEEFYGNGAAVPQPQSQNWLIEYCAFNNNKLRGLRILHVDHLTMEHCEIKDNLDDGFQYIGRESHLNDILVSGNDKPDANQKDFGNGGFNFSSKRSLVENMTVRDNRGAGFRGDFQNEDVIVKNCTFEDNLGGGVIVEVTFGPVLFLNCSIERNNFGVKISAAHHVTLDSCQINDNRDSQIDIASQFRDKDGECGIDGPPSDLDQINWHCNPSVTLDGVVNTTIRNSFISTAKTDSSQLYTYETFGNQPDKTWYEKWYKNEFIAENNVYSKPDTISAFVTDYWTDSTANSLVERISTLSEWKALTGSDNNSRWANNKPASISITNPTSASLITVCDSSLLTAEIFNFQHSLEQVAFYADSQLIGLDTTATDGWNTTWKNITVGSKTLTAVATDIFDNTVTSTALVINIQADTQPPTVIARDTTITLVNGQATITAADLDSGSTDACGIDSVSLDKTTFDCSAIGTQTVTLTVTDVNGNAASATATITVAGEVQTAPSIAVSRTDNTNTGTGMEQTIVLGYGAQSLTLTASTSGSAEGAAYSWSPATGLSSVSGPCTVFTPTVAGLYTFTATAANSYGCQASATVTITVIDGTCGNKGDKIKVCHNGQEICISPNAVKAHLAHGDKIGSCGSSYIADNRSFPNDVKSFDNILTLQVFPNPAANKATIAYHLPEAARILLEVYDLSGKKVAALVNREQEAGQQQEIYDSSLLAEGIYIVKLQAGNESYNIKLIVAK